MGLGCRVCGFDFELGCSFYMTLLYLVLFSWVSCSVVSFDVVDYVD